MFFRSLTCRSSGASRLQSKILGIRNPKQLPHMPKLEKEKPMSQLHALALGRTPAQTIEPLIADRWSPRAMSGEPVTAWELARLFEAARWAPSSYNAQPWRFLYALRESPTWPVFFNLMVEANQDWTKNAGALLVVLSRRLFEHNGKPSITHSFDAGAAWENLALQATAMGLVSHGMQGFDYEAARRDLNVPEEFQVEAMIAIGRPGKEENLSEALRAKEKPADRKPVAEIAFEGFFPGKVIE